MKESLAATREALYGAYRLSLDALKAAGESLGRLDELCDFTAAYALVLD